MIKSLLSPASEADHDLKRRVSRYLADRQVPALRKLDIEVAEGKVTLRGEVRSFYHKALSIGCCQRVAGVRQIIDAVSVAEACT